MENQLETFENLKIKIKLKEDLFKGKELWIASYVFLLAILRVQADIEAENPGELDSY